MWPMRKLENDGNVLCWQEVNFLRLNMNPDCVCVFPIACDQVLDDCIFAFFAVEMVIKMVALGIFGPNCYLGDKWNQLDFVIVMAGCVSPTMLCWLTPTSHLRRDNGRLLSINKPFHCSLLPWWTGSKRIITRAHTHTHTHTCITLVSANNQTSDFLWLQGDGVLCGWSQRQSVSHPYRPSAQATAGDQQSSKWVHCALFDFLKTHFIFLRSFLFCLFVCLFVCLWSSNVLNSDDLMKPRHCMNSFWWF